MASCGTLTLQEALSEEDIGISNCSIDSSTITSGQSVTVSWSWTNASNTPAMVDWEIQIGGTAVRTGSRSVSASNPGTNSETITPQSGGNVEVVVTSVSEASFAMMSPNGGCSDCGSGKNGSKKLQSFNSGMGGLLNR